MSGTKNKAVIRLQNCCLKSRSIAMEVASASGIDSVCIDGPDSNRLVVIGSCFDPIDLTKSLKKKLGCADLISFEECKPKPVEQPKPKECCCCCARCPPCKECKPGEKPKPKECCCCCPCGRCPPCASCSGPVYYQPSIPLPPPCFQPPYIIMQDDFRGPSCSIM